MLNQFTRAFSVTVARFMKISTEIKRNQQFNNIFKP